MLGIVSLRQDSPDAADLAVSLGALKDWTALFGPGLIVPFGNGLILGYLMYTSGLVPRRLTWFGLIGGPILLIGSLVTFVDGWAEGDALPALLVAPEFIWEAFLGIYCAIWGFRQATHQSFRRARFEFGVRADSALELRLMYRHRPGTPAECCVERDPSRFGDMTP